jgi:hypothetical protein
MGDLIEQFRALPPPARRRVHFQLRERALFEWNAFCAKKRLLRYVEGVAGTRQVVDPALPSDALEAARTGEDTLNVEHRYAEPITALHDEDWSPPEPTRFAYYSIYNLFEKYARGLDVDDWLIVNQAMASLPPERIGPLLSECISAASQQPDQHATS